MYRKDEEMEALQLVFQAEKYLKDEPETDLEVETPDCILM